MNYELMRALNDHNDRLARRLLATVHDINERDQRGVSYLHMARTVPMITLLLKRGAHINAQDDRGHTALHYARTDDICRFLLDCGIDPLIKDSLGCIGLDGFDSETRHELVLYWMLKNARDQQKRFLAAFSEPLLQAKPRVM